MEQFSSEQLDREVYYLLSYHEGKENAIERWAMVEKIFGQAVPLHLRNDDNIQDREIRFAVGRLRAKGYLICDLGDGHGRYLAANESEFWELYNYYLKPIRSRSAILHAMKKSAARRWPNVLQMSLFNLDEIETGVMS